MQFIERDQCFLYRRGFRGRYITFYWHTYNGEVEPTERLHKHPFRLAISIQLKGWLREHRVWNGIGVVDGVFQRLFTRFAPSIQIYGFTDEHRIMQGEGRTFFIGLFRTQVASPNATIPVPEGYAHYTELTNGEYQEAV